VTSTTFRAMGTEIEAWGDPTGLAEVAVMFEEIEQVCSRFRPNSELSLINGSPSTVHNPSAMLLEVLQAADSMRSRTGGLVDIGVGGLVSAWGYDRTFEEVRGLETAPEIPPERSSWQVSGGSLRRPSETSLDLGGIAKGWACDQAVERGLATVVSAGGDLRSAHPETMVSVEDPWGGLAARIALGRGALATSSTARRRWQVAGAEVSHLIDPRTGRPVRSPVLSSTVIAATAVEAEAGAKTVLIRGESGLDWANSQSWIEGALVVWHDGSVFATSGMEVAA
jgi:FAD:protein FMN transferase